MEKQCQSFRNNFCIKNVLNMQKCCDVMRNITAKCKNGFKRLQNVQMCTTAGSPQQFLQLIHGIGDGDGTGLLHFGNRSITPADTDAGDPVGLCADYIERRIANHQHRAFCSTFCQQISNDRLLGVSGTVRSRAADPGKVFC